MLAPFVLGKSQQQKGPPMNNALKRELAVAALILSATSKNKYPRLSTALSMTSGALFLTSLSNNFSFQGKSVLITGGSRGLGLSLAWNLLERGAQVTLLARNKDELEKGKEKLLADYPSASIFTHVCDITNPEQLKAAFDNALVDMNGIDLLINNAGSILVGPFGAMEMNDFRAQMELHLYSAIHTTQLVVPHFKSRGGGRILNICSMGGKVAVPHMLPYDASKFALAGFSQGITAELAKDNILVTTAYPTVLRTGSAIQAVFKGDHEKEFAWFETIDNAPGFSMGADEAAKKILDGVALGQGELILSMPAKLRMNLGSFLPETMNFMMNLANRILPKDESKLRRTGADSVGLMERTPFLKVFLETARKEEARYNQEPQHDAEQNMSLLH